jgi:ferrochelatase
MRDSSSPTTAVFLMAHGAPTRVADIPLYLKNIRGGRDSTPEVIQLIQERYEAIGGSSPLLEITKGQSKALEKFLNQDGNNTFKVYFGMRSWSPYIKDVVRQMMDDGIQKVFAICLAPQYSKWSTERYFKSFNEALKECGRADDIEVRYIASWCDHPCLTDAFVEKYQQAIEPLQQKGKDEVHTVFTVHSIPASSLDEGDPYADEYEKTVRKIIERVKPTHWHMAYQSQGMIPVPWLGPTVESVLDKIARTGLKKVLIVPVGFVSDHIEILYDIDIQFKNYAKTKKLDLYRTESMNLSPAFIEALSAIVWENKI